MHTTSEHRASGLNIGWVTSRSERDVESDNVCQPRELLRCRVARLLDAHIQHVVEEEIAFKSAIINRWYSRQDDGSLKLNLNDRFSEKQKKCPPRRPPNSAKTQAL